MPGPAPFLSKTTRLFDRIEAGDREAAFDLARLYRPENLTDFLDFVCPSRTPTTRLFDTLADAYDAWLHTAR